MRADIWIARDDQALAIAGVLLALSHLAFLVLIVSWFALRKPTSWGLYKYRLRAVLRREPIPDRLPPGFGRKPARVGAPQDRA